MKIGQVGDFIVRHYLKEDKIVHSSKNRNERRTSILLIGPPGIGKSVAICEGSQKIAEIKEKEWINYSEIDGSLAKEIWNNPEKYFGFADFPLTHSEPTDLMGRPEKHPDLPAAYYQPFLWAVCFSKMAGIVFLDELTNVQRMDTLSASYKVSLDQLVGFTELSKDVLVIAAGNNPEQSSVANYLPWPLLGRFTVVEVDPPTINEWAAWMDAHYEAWDTRVLGYLYLFGEDFCSPLREPEGLTNFPCPRNWTIVATRLPAQPYDSSDDETYVVGRLGPEVGGKLLGFLRTDIPPIEELLNKPEQFRNLKVNRSENLNAQYFATTILAQYLKEKVKVVKTEDKHYVENPEVIEKTIPLLKVMLDVHQELLALAIQAIGEEKKYPVVLEWYKKDKDLKKYFDENYDTRSRLWT